MPRRALSLARTARSGVVVRPPHPAAAGSPTKESAMSSPSPSDLRRLLHRAADAPRWVAVALAIVVAAATAVIAGHRHLAPTPAADAAATRPASGAADDVRQPLASRDLDRTAARPVEQRVRPSIPVV